jgi:hypothetical protein
MHEQVRYLQIVNVKNVASYDHCSGESTTLKRAASWSNSLISGPAESSASSRGVNCSELAMLGGRARVSGASTERSKLPSWVPDWREKPLERYIAGHPRSFLIGEYWIEGSMSREAMELDERGTAEDVE